MQLSSILRAWGAILRGRQPVLSIEITKACPLACPGCYAFHPDHLSGSPITSLADFKGDELVEGILELVNRHDPLVVYIVGGEPLVRYRELNVLLPELERRGVRSEIVTSAVRPIPPEWTELEGLKISVSVDGLQPEHDERRKPATYERILKHIRGHDMVIHCTVTSQMMKREGYLEEFVRFWNEQPGVWEIWMSFFTPQVGETSAEILTPEMRERAVGELRRLRPLYRRLRLPRGMLEGLLEPPRSPRHCMFARVTRCLSADLETPVEPCQFGGEPKCSECGCAASLGMHALGKRRLAGLVPVSSLFDASVAVGSAVQTLKKPLGRFSG